MNQPSSSTTVWIFVVRPSAFADGLSVAYVSTEPRSGGSDGATTYSGALSAAVVFLHNFNDLPDSRQYGKVMYRLDEILLLALLAVLAEPNPFFSDASGHSLTALHPMTASATFSPPSTWSNSTVVSSPGPSR